MQTSTISWASSNKFVEIYEIVSPDHKTYQTVRFLGSNGSFWESLWVDNLPKYANLFIVVSIESEIGLITERNSPIIQRILIIFIRHVVAYDRSSYYEGCWIDSSYRFRPHSHLTSLYSQHFALKITSIRFRLHIFRWLGQLFRL